MNKIFLLLFVFYSSANFAQSSAVFSAGTITYITNQNVYVRFDSTQGILSGDTLFAVVDRDTIPSLITKYLSSKSVAAEPLAKINFQINQTIFARLQKPALIEDPAAPQIIEDKRNDIPVVRQTQSIEPERMNVSGRISLQSSSEFANQSEFNTQRWRSSALINISHLAPALDFSAYAIFSARNSDFRNTGYNALRDIRLYDFTFLYRIDSTYRFWLGRHLNFKTANAGTMDGLQAEAQFDPFVYGLVIGSHPDFGNYDLNLKMFQAGGYISHRFRRDNLEMENTVAAFHQTNHFKTDRDFIYLQHNNNLLPKINFFLSSEVDLFAFERGKKKHAITLTGIYTSLQYRYSSDLSFTASYDARRNVVYLETYKSFLDSAFSNDIRQGFRVQANFRLSQSALAGLSSGYRFQKGDAAPSINYSGFMYITSLPLISSDLAMNISYLKNSYLKGAAASAVLTRSFTQEFSGSAGFRTFIYSYVNPTGTAAQYIPFFDCSYALSRTILLSLNFEGVYEKIGNSTRLFIDLTTRL